MTTVADLCGLSEPFGFGYMATPLKRLAALDLPRIPEGDEDGGDADGVEDGQHRDPFGGRGGTGRDALPLGRVLRLRLLLRELRAGSVSGVGRDDPGRVLRLDRARELLAQVRAQHLRVDADLLGERLRGERVRHGSYLLALCVGRLIDHALTIHARCAHVNPVRKCLQTLYIVKSWTPPAAPPKDQLTCGFRLRRAKRAGREIFGTTKTAYAERVVA